MPENRVLDEHADQEHMMNFGDWVANGRLLEPNTGEELVRVEAQIWVMEPAEDQPGKWGGSFRMEPPISDTLKPLDFMFVLELDDGRRANIFSELDFDAGTGSIDGNGPPPS